MRIAILLCAALLCARAEAQQVGAIITGSVTSVASGDTFRLGYNLVSLWGIDSPDRRARCMINGVRWKPALDSTDGLRECMKGTTISCRVQRIEYRFPRNHYVAECWRDDTKQDVGACMVRAGWATDFPGYSGGHYAALEAEPKATASGLWKCGVPPTRRWCGSTGVACERPVYKPRGPSP